MRHSPYQLSRREFLRGCAFCGLGLAAGVLPVCAAPKKDGIREAPALIPKEAFFWEPLDNGRVRCTTCPNFCEREEGGATACRTRINRGGKLYTLTYARPCVIYVDQLEKNPLYHVAPGINALATATAGCNLCCHYCQNWDISQVGPGKTRNMDLAPEALVGDALERKLKWLTFSYTEPVAYYEYALDSARLARSQGLKVAIVTAGIINPKPLEKLMEQSDAFSVTIKGYTQAFYREVCGANLEDVWKTVRALVQAKKWVEAVTLVVPGMNDAEAGLRSIARGLAQLSPDIPLHFLRFAPAYKLKHLTQTPVATLEKARAAARQEGLKFVYLSNLPGHSGANTTCPACAKTLIERAGFKVLANNIRGGRCPFCGHAIPGIELG